MIIIIKYQDGDGENIMCDQCLRTVFIYQEDYHKLLKAAHPQRLAFQKQCPRSINIEYSQRFTCNTHTDRQTN